MNRASFSILVSLVVLGLVGLTFYFALQAEDEAEGEVSSDNGSQVSSQSGELISNVDEFTGCLDEADAIIYGSVTCPACGRLADKFGGYEAMDPIYVECTEDGDRCASEKLTGFVPEAQVDGELIEAADIVGALSRETGCEVKYEE